MGDCARFAHNIALEKPLFTDPRGLRKERLQIPVERLVPAGLLDHGGAAIDGLEEAGIPGQHRPEVAPEGVGNAFSEPAGEHPALIARLRPARQVALHHLAIGFDDVLVLDLRFFLDAGAEQGVPARRLPLPERPDHPPPEAQLADHELRVSLGGFLKEGEGCRALVEPHRVANDPVPEGIRRGLRGSGGSENVVDRRPRLRRIGDHARHGLGLSLLGLGRERLVGLGDLHALGHVLAGRHPLRLHVLGRWTQGRNDELHLPAPLDLRGGHAGGGDHVLMEGGDRTGGHRLEACERLRVGIVLDRLPAGVAERVFLALAKDGREDVQLPGLVQRLLHGLALRDHSGDRLGPRLLHRLLVLAEGLELLPQESLRPLDVALACQRPHLGSRRLGQAGGSEEVVGGEKFRPALEIRIRPGPAADHRQWQHREEQFGLLLEQVAIDRPPGNFRHILVEGRKEPLQHEGRQILHVLLNHFQTGCGGGAGEESRGDRALGPGDLVEEAVDGLELAQCQCGLALLDECLEGTGKHGERLRLLCGHGRIRRPKGPVGIPGQGHGVDRPSAASHGGHHVGDGLGGGVKPAHGKELRSHRINVVFCREPKLVPKVDGVLVFSDHGQSLVLDLVRGLVEIRPGHRLHDSSPDLISVTTGYALKHGFHVFLRRSGLFGGNLDTLGNGPLNGDGLTALTDGDDRIHSAAQPPVELLDQPLHDALPPGLVVGAGRHRRSDDELAVFGGDHHHHLGQLPIARSIVDLAPLGQGFVHRRGIFHIDALLGHQGRRQQLDRRAMRSQLLVEPVLEGLELLVPLLLPPHIGGVLAEPLLEGQLGAEDAQVLERGFLGGVGDLLAGLVIPRDAVEEMLVGRGGSSPLPFRVDPHQLVGLAACTLLGDSRGLEPLSVEELELLVRGLAEVLVEGNKRVLIKAMIGLGEERPKGGCPLVAKALLLGEHGETGGLLLGLVGTCERLRLGDDGRVVRVGFCHGDGTKGVLFWDGHHMVACAGMV